MKKEIPPFAIAIAAVVGLAVLVGVFFMAGGGGGMSPTEKGLAEKQTQIQTERFDAAMSGELGGGAGGGEAAAREKNPGQ
jgi:hypothetical protein